MSDFTPAPWIAQQNEFNDWFIWSRSPDRALATVYVPSGADEQRAANAYLIAAAPELLEALELMWRRFLNVIVDPNDPESPRWGDTVAGIKCAAAIDKAHGRAVQA